MYGYYESIPGFRYWDTKAWKQYIQEYVTPIYSATTVFLDVRHELAPYLNHSLDTLADSKKELLSFLIGGIKNGEYTKYSLARLIRLLFGIYVDPQEFSNAVANLGQEGLREVTIKEEKKDDAAFFRLINGLNKLSENVLELADIEPTNIPVDSGEVISNPERLLDVLTEFYKSCVLISANHNYYTFFIVSTRGTHWRFLRGGYKKLEENIGILKEFLGLEELFVPETDKGDIQRDYTIWSHSQGSIADSIFLIQFGLWAGFNFRDLLRTNKTIEEALRYITPKPENLAESYMRLVKENVPNLEQISIGNEKFYPEDTYKLEIEGLWVVRWPDETLLSTDVTKGIGNRHILIKSEQEKPKLPLIEFLDRIGPYLFVEYGEIAKHPKYDRYLMYYGNIPMNAIWWLG